ncbi:protein of unknown function DUF459 [Solidesulfovibrio carbinoliphilus subsp. oakridgensis]|uniref:Uncharacterized protein n=1 Tax=Solidesulfovibrio carbinoliphilus subsp. oakridgensis TaxID=694327 RepID=G7Q5J0_9BACT|nr:DUF459 domain-containing protein [Solidesulfovibrio carbinoliphilus]EHJ48991.1 protein of unknown function DUF459 [Solidesulfovibrio carbinoliphilus subsp. oakridgensis]
MHQAALPFPCRPGRGLLALAALAAVLLGAPGPTHPGLAPLALPRPATPLGDELRTLVANLDLSGRPDAAPAGPDRHVLRLAVTAYTVRLVVDPQAAHPLSGPVAVGQDRHLGAPGRTLRLVSLAPADTGPQPPAAPRVAVKNMPPEADRDVTPETSPVVVAEARPLGPDSPGPRPTPTVASAATPTPVQATSPVAVPVAAAPASAPVGAPGRSILVAGDSLSIFLADALRPLLAGRPGASFAARGKVSSGLARPDFFNWEREMAALAASGRPDTVLVMIATNDNQTLTRPDGRKLAFGRPGWNEEYARRVRRLVELARQGNPDARVYWIGAPVMADPGLNADVAAINAVIARQLAALPGCRFVDVSRTLADAAGHYAPALPSPAGPRTARTPDGVHLTPFGAKLLAHAALASMSPAVAALDTR